MAVNEISQTEVNSSQLFCPYHRDLEVSDPVYGSKV